jgi:predicted transposase YbfD/YdcC
MEYSTLERWQEIGETGVIHDKGSLYGRFHNIKDPRSQKGKQYSLVMLLSVIFLAKLAGKDKPDEIADWARHHAEELAKILMLREKRMPSHSTIRRVFHTTLDESEFDRMAQAYQQQEETGSGKVLAMDGKALRGTRIAGQERSDQVLSLYDVQDQLVLAQEAVETKENEIVAAPRILAQVAIAGKVITGDALHTQRAISATIVERGGAYLWPVKTNQPRLYESIERLFAQDTPKPGFGKIITDFKLQCKVNYGHGRLEKRTILTSSMLNDYLDWPDVGQVYRIERNFDWIRQGKVFKTSSEVEYGITSLLDSQASPTQLLELRRQHWFVETGLHYRRDVTFREDATRMTIGAAGRVLATLHNLLIGLIKRAGYSNAAKARRYYEGHIDQAFLLLLSSTKTLS